LDLGFVQAGFSIKVCVEIDPFCCNTLRHNRPSWKIIEKDITLVPTKEILEVAGISEGEATVVIGGPPCQPFSTLGKKKALEDPRGKLVLEYIRVIREARPKAFLFENVPGIKSVNRGRILTEVLEAFTELGYGVNYEIMNSADFGVPQLRRRLFIIGHRDGRRHIFPKGSHSKNGIRGKKWVTVGEAFQRLKDEIWDFNRPDNKVFRHSDEMKYRMSLIEPGKNFWSLPLDLRPPCWKNGKHLGKDTFGRMEADKPAPTIRTCAYNPTKGRYIHPFENRGLNTLEMAILQGFPKDYFFSGGLVQIGRQIGDAVPPPLAKALATSIIMQLGTRCYDLLNYR